MSLIKRYLLGCEASTILIRRQVQPAATMAEQDELLATGKTERRAQTRGCLFVTEQASTSKEARAAARKAGWVRHHEEFKAYPGADYSNKITFDVCPSCAPKVIAELPSLPVRTAGEAEAVAGLERNRATAAD